MSGPSAEQSASRGAAAVLPVLSRATERDQRASAGVARTRAQMEEHDSNSWHVVVSCVVLLYLTMALGFHLTKTKKLSGVVVAVVISSCSFLVTQTNFFREISFQLSIVGVVSMAVHVISHRDGGGGPRNLSPPSPEALPDPSGAFLIFFVVFGELWLAGTH